MNKKFALAGTSVIISAATLVGIVSAGGVPNSVERQGEFFLLNRLVYVPGTGDCFADSASGDFYRSGYCNPDYGISVNPTAISTKKPKETKTPVIIITTEVPGIVVETETPDDSSTATEIPTKETTPTPKPTKTPAITETSTEAPPTEETPACDSKNKNDDKKEGENPCDGNAGWGNG